jgi:hypothetical protein
LALIGNTIGPPSSTLSRTTGALLRGLSATAIQQPISSQTAVATPSIRTVLPT